MQNCLWGKSKGDHVRNIKLPLGYADKGILSCKKMKPSVKISILVAWLMGLVGLFIGLYMYNLEAEDLQKAKPEFVITAAGLQKAFEDNEAAANTKYSDKIIEVSGIIESVKPGEDEAVSITLKTESPLSAVICTFQSGTAPAVFKIGDQITVRGKYSGFLMDILLNNCVVVK